MKIPSDQLLHYFEKPEEAKRRGKLILDRIPKKKRGVPYRCHGGSNYGWGIVQKELFFQLVFLWLCSTAFAVWWMKDNPKDLQNALLPASMVTAVAALLIVVPSVLQYNQNRP